MSTRRPLQSEDRSGGATPRISVVVPSYNSATYLRQAIESVLQQIPPPHEVIVQDGDSSDATVRILQSFGDLVSWRSEPDGGQADALNRALARTSGDVVVWLNADDILMPGALAVAGRAFSTDPELAFAYGDFDVIDANGALLRKYRSSDYSWERVYARGCYIFSGSLFVRRSVLESGGGFDASLHACMDLDLLLRLGKAGRSVHLRHTVGQLRMHGINKSSSKRLMFLREAFRIRGTYAGRSPRLWLIALWAAARSAITLAATPIRFSPRWPRHGASKTL